MTNKIDEIFKDTNESLVGKYFKKPDGTYIHVFGRNKNFKNVKYKVMVFLKLGSLLQFKNETTVTEDYLLDVVKVSREEFKEKLDELLDSIDNYRNRFK